MTRKFDSYDDYKRHLKNKYGVGEGINYKPWLTIRDVKGKNAFRSIVKGITTGRKHHFLSSIETQLFYILEFNKNTIDIREQFPLDPEKTSNISERAGIPHPAVSGVAQIMTTDFLVDLLNNGKVIQIAISVKYENELEDERVVEKQELERRYWESIGVKWYIFTENEVPPTLIQNIKWLIPQMHSFDLNQDDQFTVFNVINEALLTYPEDKIAVVMKILDQKYQAEGGTYLSYLRHLLAQNAFAWDVVNISHKALTTGQLKASEHWISKEYEYVHAQ